MDRTVSTPAKRGARARRGARGQVGARAGGGGSGGLALRMCGLAHDATTQPSPQHGSTMALCSSSTGTEKRRPKMSALFRLLMPWHVPRSARARGAGRGVPAEGGARTLPSRAVCRFEISTSSDWISSRETSLSVDIGQAALRGVSGVQRSWSVMQDLDVSPDLAPNMHPAYRKHEFLFQKHESWPARNLKRELAFGKSLGFQYE